MIACLRYLAAADGVACGIVIVGRIWPASDSASVLYTYTT